MFDVLFSTKLFDYNYSDADHFSLATIVPAHQALLSRLDNPSDPFWSLGASTPSIQSTQVTWGNKTGDAFVIAGSGLDQASDLAQLEANLVAAAANVIGVFDTFEVWLGGTKAMSLALTDTSAVLTSDTLQLSMTGNIPNSLQEIYDFLSNANQLLNLLNFGSNVTTAQIDAFVTFFNNYAVTGFAVTDGGVDAFRYTETATSITVEFAGASLVMQGTFAQGNVGTYLGASLLAFNALNDPAFQTLSIGDFAGLSLTDVTLTDKNGLILFNASGDFDGIQLDASGNATYQNVTVTDAFIHETTHFNQIAFNLTHATALADIENPNDAFWTLKDLTPSIQATQITWGSISSTSDAFVISGSGLDQASDFPQLEANLAAAATNVSGIFDTFEIWLSGTKVMSLALTDTTAVVTTGAQQITLTGIIPNSLQEIYDFIDNMVQFLSVSQSTASRDVDALITFFDTYAVSGLSVTDAGQDVFRYTETATTLTVEAAGASLAMNGNFPEGSLGVYFAAGLQAIWALDGQPGASISLADFVGLSLTDVTLTDKNGAVVYQASGDLDSVQFAADGSVVVPTVIANTLFLEGTNGQDEILVPYSLPSDGTASVSINMGADHDWAEFYVSDWRTYDVSPTFIDGGTGFDSVYIEDFGNNFGFGSNNDIEIDWVSGTFSGSDPFGAQEFSVDFANIDRFTLALNAGGATVFGDEFRNQIDLRQITGFFQFDAEGGWDVLRLNRTEWSDGFATHQGFTLTELQAFYSFTELADGSIDIYQVGQNTGPVGNISGVEAIRLLADDRASTVEVQVSEILGKTDFTGTQNDDEIDGNDLDNLIIGLDGNDDISGYGGTDTIDAGAGNDFIRVEGGANHVVDGGADGDSVYVIDDFSAAVRYDFENGKVQGLTSLDPSATAGYTVSIVNVEGARIDNPGDVEVIGSSTENFWITLGSLPTSLILHGNSGTGWDGIGFGYGDFFGDGRNGMTVAEAQALFSFAVDPIDPTHITISRIDGASPIVVGELFDIGRIEFRSADRSSVDQYQLSEFLGITDFTGTEFDDTIDGNNLDNVIDGLAGSDQIRGLCGTDTIDGGAGTDHIRVWGGANHVVDGGADWDSLAVDDSTSAALRYDFVNGVVQGLSSLNAGATVDYSITMTNIEGADIATTGDVEVVGPAGGDVYVNVQIMPSYLSILGDASSATNAVSLAWGDYFGDSRQGMTTLEAQALFSLDVDPLDPSHITITRIDGASPVLVGDLYNVSFIEFKSDDRLTIDRYSIFEFVNGNIIDGTPGADTLVSVTGHDTLNGLGGDDSLLGADGPDSLVGGAGNDTLEGGRGSDVALGGDGNDLFIHTGSIADVEFYDAGAGQDRVIIDYSYVTDPTVSDTALDLGGTQDNLYIVGNPGISDTLLNFEEVVMSGGVDMVVTGTTANNYVQTDGGSDTVTSGGGSDTIITGAGDDLITIERGSHVIDGGAGTDVVDFGDDISEWLVVDFANDQLQGRAGLDATDTVYYTTTFTNVEDVVWRGAQSVKVVGTGGTDVITPDLMPQYLLIDNTGGSGTVDLSDTLITGVGRGMSDFDLAGLIVYPLDATGTNFIIAQQVSGVEVEIGRLFGISKVQVLDSQNPTGTPLPLVISDLPNTQSFTLIVEGYPQGGNAAEDMTLSVDGALLGSVGTITYQWTRDGADISSATASSYTLTQSDVGTNVTVIATFTGGGSPMTAIGPVNQIANVNDALLGTVTISGAVEEGSLLTADVSGLSDEDGLGAPSYQWQRDGSPITGATADTYTSTNADVGAAMSVVVSYTDNLGSAESTTSAATSVITNVNNAPAGAVIVSGAAVEGSVLTADASGITDGDGLGTLSYQWLRDGSPITGETAITYTSTNADVGAAISVSISYTDAHGTAESVTSTATSAITNVNDVPVGSVTISGTTAEGSVLTADASGITDADGLGTIGYQWLRDGSPISGATSDTYTPTNADVGTSMSVSASYTDGHGTVESVTSSTTSPVTNVNTSPTGTVTVSGDVAEGSLLTADPSGIADGDGLGTFSYQWLRDGSSITGATAATYTSVDTDVGAVLSVVASYSDGQGTTETLTSAATSVITNVNNAPAGAVIVSGAAVEGSVLTADASGITDGDGLGTLSYQWLRDGSPITLATAATYQLKQGDVGTNVTVQVSYTDGHGASESVTSAAVSGISNVNDNPLGIMTIQGTVTEGQTLTVNTTRLADEDGLPSTLNYQWVRTVGGIDTDITGATSASYTAGADDVDAQLYVRVSYSDAFTNAETHNSLVTSTVSNVNDAAQGAVTVSGVTTEGRTLTADTSALTDVDGMTNAPVALQWVRDGVAIQGATSKTYVLTQSDVGSSISVSFAFTDDRGGSESGSSTPTAAVANLNDAATGTVLISGTPTEGATLTADTSGISDLDGMTGASFSYQWKANGVAITGATSSSLVLAQAQVSQTISVDVSFTDDLLGPETVASETTSAVTNTNNSTTGAVSISGSTTEGSTLTADATGLSDTDGLTNATYAYQWLRDGSQISGATAKTYDVTALDGNSVLSVQVRFTDDLGTAETVTSAATATVEAINIAGTDASETIAGNSLANLINAGAGDDTVTGSGANDTINAGTGSDSLDGGTGDDEYSADGRTTDTVTISDNAGTDTLVLFDYAGVDAKTLVWDGSTVKRTTTYGHETIIGSIAAVPVIEQLRWEGAHNGSPYANSLQLVVSQSDFTRFDVAYAGTDSADVIIAPTLLSSSSSAPWGEIYANGGDDVITLANNFLHFVYAGDGNDVITVATGSTTPVAAAAVTPKAVVEPTVDQSILAGAGRDSIETADGNDSLYGEAGSDTLNGGAGNDLLSGGDNDDWLIHTRGGEDTYDGGNGFDFLALDFTGETSPTSFTYEIDLAGGTMGEVGSTLNRDSVVSVEGVDVTGSVSVNVTGSDSGNSLKLGGGNDSVDGGGGADALEGGIGNDTLLGGTGNDFVVGDAGNDSIDGGTGTDIAFYEGTYAYHTGPIATFTGTNVDYVVTEGTSGEVIIYTRTNTGEFDTVTNVEYFSFTDNMISLTMIKSGADNTGNAIDKSSETTSQNLAAGGGSDTVGGGSGADTIDSGTGNDSVSGGAGNDNIFDALGDDTIAGGEGSDTGRALSGNNSFAEADEATAEDDLTIDDFYSGGYGDDNFETGGGNDVVIGDRASIYFFGDDTIMGGTGDDILESSGGRDVFIFRSGDGDDLIGKVDVTSVSGATFINEVLFTGADFENGVDKVKLSGFSGVTTTAELEAALLAGTSFKVIDDGIGNAQFVTPDGSITFIGISTTDVGADDFIF